MKEKLEFGKVKVPSVCGWLFQSHTEGGWEVPGLWGLCRVREGIEGHFGEQDEVHFQGCKCPAMHLLNEDHPAPDATSSCEPGQYLSIEYYTQ